MFLQLFKRRQFLAKRWFTKRLKRGDKQFVAVNDGGRNTRRCRIDLPNQLAVRQSDRANSIMRVQNHLIFPDDGRRVAFIEDARRKQVRVLPDDFAAELVDRQQMGIV